jgi:N-acetylmuramoyl-L-alanine amidase
MRKIRFYTGFCWFLLLAVLFPSSGEAAMVSFNKFAYGHGLRPLSSLAFGNNDVKFVFEANSRALVFNKTKIFLGFSTIVRHGEIFVDESDYKYHVMPLLAPASYRKNVRTVAIDAGHGGKDRGTISKSNKQEEKLVTLDICLRLAKLLEQHGYRVILTRVDDRAVPLSERTHIANRQGADLFISVHCNSAPSVTANGIETFILTPPSQASTYQKSSKNATERLPGNGFDESNTIFGYSLQSSLVEKTKALDRGVKHNKFMVLRNLKCPGALVECGFLSNTTESAKIASAGYREKLAQAIFAGINRFVTLTSGNRH